MPRYHFSVILERREEVVELSQSCELILTEVLWSSEGERASDRGQVISLTQLMIQPQETECYQGKTRRENRRALAGKDSEPG